MTGAEIEPPKESINTVMHTLAMMPWPPGLGFKIRMRSDLSSALNLCIYRMVISWVVPVYLKIWYIQDIVCSVYSRLRSYIISLQYSWLPHCGTKFQWNANKPIWTLFKHLWTRHKGPLAQLPLYIAWSWSIDGTRYHPNSLDWNCQGICRTAFLLTSAGQH